MNLPFGTITVTDTARRLVLEALDSKRLSSGRLVRRFEELFASNIGAQEAVAVSSGTDADALALAALYDFGAKRGDEVITPALSFVATGNSVLQAGFKPVFVDVDLETLNIDPSLIESAITDRTVAILPVHLMGKPADMDAINDIARRHDLFVIEDAAEAHGATYKGRNAGTLGDMSAFSLYVAHIITSVEGGVVVTQREDFAEVLRSLRSHGRACKCRQCVINTADKVCPRRFGDGPDRRFVFERIGYSCKMNELEAAIGLGSLELYEEILSRRGANLAAMMQAIEPFAPNLFTFRQEPHERIGPHALPIIVGQDAPFTRDELVQWLRQNEIDSRNLFECMPTQCRGFAFLGYRLGEFPNAEYIAENGLHVGVHQDLGPAHIDYFARTIRDFVLSRSANLRTAT
ncbi:MAG: DegT/DnrJ/EryC1/StrS family aminotransferase [Planctomycetes bacterium]|jgi:dTDP-4-amino-4,6-dideoxygalactose transaminase|nr:DegT/DnrJ/EryC1/StrS family aminotransferase [Planctomycetota bacterium]